MDRARKKVGNERGHLLTGGFSAAEALAAMVRHGPLSGAGRGATDCTGGAVDAEASEG